MNPLDATARQRERRRSGEGKLEGYAGSIGPSAHSIPLSPVVAHRPLVPAAGALSFRKRGIDLVVSLLLLLVFAPIMAIAAIAIRLTSPGPVLFRQRRLGVCGMPFTMLKFRTMHANASDEPHRSYVAGMIKKHDKSLSNSGAYKLLNDSRVTMVGRILRRTSLDELPQLFNVLRGEMSVVGPRPALEYEVADYEPWQYERLCARPGITGLWQVSGRNRLSYVEMCRLDVKYVQTWSVLSDLVIIARTPWVMISNNGNAA